MNYSGLTPENNDNMTAYCRDLKEMYIDVGASLHAQAIKDIAGFIPFIEDACRDSLQFELFSPYAESDDIYLLIVRWSNSFFHFFFV